MKKTKIDNNKAFKFLKINLIAKQIKNKLEEILNNRINNNKINKKLKKTKLLIILK